MTFPPETTRSAFFNPNSIFLHNYSNYVGVCFDVHMKYWPSTRSYIGRYWLKVAAYPNVAPWALAGNHSGSTDFAQILDTPSSSNTTSMESLSLAILHHKSFLGKRRKICDKNIRSSYIQTPQPKNNQWQKHNKVTQGSPLGQYIPCTSKMAKKRISSSLHYKN